MRAWLFQAHGHKQKYGEGRAPWSVEWYDSDGNKRSKKIGSKSMAEKHQRKIEGQLAARMYQNDSRKNWSEFRAEWEKRILPRLKPRTRRCVLATLEHFERIAKPKKVVAIKTRTIDDFVARRQTEDGKKPESKTSPATINRQLRELKAVLNVAHELGYLPTVPKFRMVKEPKKIPRYVAPEHFTAIYEACVVAKLPRNLPYPAADWWRALLVFNYMTGWRIGEPLALRREDLDVEQGRAITRADDNKGGRDDIVPLHAVVVEHLVKIQSFAPVVFPWYHHERTLWTEFAKIQAEAGIHLECHERHKHMDACHRYGFHDLRRAFATVNAETMSADALQSLMRHKSYSTTQRYINLANQLNRAVEKLHVPEVLA